MMCLNQQTLVFAPNHEQVPAIIFPTAQAYFHPVWLFGHSRDIPGSSAMAVPMDCHGPYPQEETNQVDQPGSSSLPVLGAC